MRHSFIILFVISCFCASSAQAGGWSLKQKNGGPVIEAEGTASAGDLRVKAFLNLSCNTTGSIFGWLDYTVADADKITKYFDLEPFEGPDATAQKKDLVTIELAGAAKPQALKYRASGWYSAEHENAFGFGIGGYEKESRALSKLFKQIAREGTLLKITVTSYGKPQQTIIAEFPLNGSREAFTALAAQCR
jgi:hypothetical protein